MDFNYSLLFSIRTEFGDLRRFTEIYGATLRIYSEYRKIRIRENSVFEHFSRGECHFKVKHFALPGSLD